MFTAKTNKLRVPLLSELVPAKLVDICHCLALADLVASQQSCSQTDKMPHQTFWGLKQVPVPNRCYGARKEHPLRLGRHFPPFLLIVAGNLWGWPVSQVLETNDVRPLIGCLQRRRHQPAALAARKERRTHEVTDARMAGPKGGGAAVMRTRWVREVLWWWRNAKAESLGVMEKVWWARRQFFAGDRCRVYLTTAPGSIGHGRGGGCSPSAQIVSFCHQKKKKKRSWRTDLMEHVKN